MTANMENARTLASVLGIDESEAAERLSLNVCVTVAHDDSSRVLGGFVAGLLARTVTVSEIAGGQPALDLEVVVGSVAPRTGANRIYVRITGQEIVVSRRDARSQSCYVPPVLLLLAACYVSAYALEVLLPGVSGAKGGRGCIVLPLEQLCGGDPARFDLPVNLGEMYLAGAGAVGNAAVYALGLMEPRGRLHVVDYDLVSAGNLNRCLWFQQSDVGHNKAKILVGRASATMPGLSLVAHTSSLAKVAASLPPPGIERLLVAVDSRRGRRSLQNEFPGEVFDASTTGIEEVVFHHHRQPTDGACMTCAYVETDGEQAHEEHVAAQLGVSLVDVADRVITPKAAGFICAKYPHLIRESVVGTAYDSLFKALCATAKLKTAEDRQVLAPFAFVSTLAGTYMAIELVLRTLQPERSEAFNYWRASPWCSPVLQLRSWRRPRVDCGFCQNPVFRDLIMKLWGRRAVA